MTPHTAVAAMRTVTWHVGQAAAMDSVLSDMVADGLPGHMIDSQRAARDDHAAKAAAAFDHVLRCLFGV